MEERPRQKPDIRLRGQNDIRRGASWAEALLSPDGCMSNHEDQRSCGDCGGEAPVLVAVAVNLKTEVAHRTSCVDHEALFVVLAAHTAEVIHTVARGRVHTCCGVEACGNRRIFPVCIQYDRPRMTATGSALEWQIGCHLCVEVEARTRMEDTRSEADEVLFHDAWVE